MLAIIPCFVKRNVVYIHSFMAIQMARIFERRGSGSIQKVQWISEGSAPIKITCSKHVEIVGFNQSRQGGSGIIRVVFAQKQGVAAAIRLSDRPLKIPSRHCPGRGHDADQPGWHRAHLSL